MDTMTDVLILGGTGWLSRRIAQRWIDAGARVTCLARGERPAPGGAALVSGDRDDPETYRLLDRDWDEVVDISSRADHVRGAVAAEQAVRALGDRTHIIPPPVSWSDRATPAIASATGRRRSPGPAPRR